VKLFGIDIAKEIAKAVAPGMLPATLTRVTPGTRTAASSSGTTPTTTSHAARGLVDDYTDFEMDGTLVQRGDRRILLVANSITGLAFPRPGDRITILDTIYTVVRVKSDLALATYTCQVRGV